MHLTIVNVNVCSGVGRFIHCAYNSLCTVGWRPAFKYYNRWVALIGALMCVAIMFVIRWYFALITIVAVGTLYMVVNTLKPGTYMYIPKTFQYILLRMMSSWMHLSIYIASKCCAVCVFFA